MKQRKTEFVGFLSRYEDNCLKFASIIVKCTTGLEALGSFQCLSEFSGCSWDPFKQFLKRPKKTKLKMLRVRPLPRRLVPLLRCEHILSASADALLWWTGGLALVSVWNCSASVQLVRVYAAQRQTWPDEPQSWGSAHALSAERAPKAPAASFHAARLLNRAQQLGKPVAHH